MDIWRGPVTPMGEMRDWRDGVRRKGTGRLASSSPTSNAKGVKGPVLPKFRGNFLHEASLEDRNDTRFETDSHITDHDCRDAAFR